MCWPGLRAVVASDPEPTLPGLSPDDILTLYFTRATNRPDVSTTPAVLALLTFTPPLASSLRATWVSGGDDVDPGAGERLIVTLAGVMNPDIQATLVPLVRVGVLPGAGLRDVGNTCPNATIEGVGLGGTWGDASQPQFLASHPAVALDYGGQPGLGTGDAIVLRFNQPVKQVCAPTHTHVEHSCRRAGLFTPTGRDHG